jgi:hypothetical protein
MKRFEAKIKSPFQKEIERLSITLLTNNDLPMSFKKTN